MKDYYSEELRALHHCAQKFATQYPQQAALLNLHNVNDRDPYVERLLEGFAFLTARIQQRIDDGIPEFSENLLRKLCPKLLRQVPSMIVLQLSCQAGMLTSKHVLAKHTKVSFTLSESMICQFKTIVDVELFPINLLAVELCHDHEANALRMRFAINNVGFYDSIPNKLRFYINAEPQLATLLYYFFKRHVRKIGLKFAGSKSLYIFNNSINSSYHSSTGLDLLHDHFNFPQKFYFLDIENLNKVPWKLEEKGFDLYFYGETELLTSVELSANNFLLHCVPAINLFSQDSVPITVDQRRQDYCILATENAAENIEIYSVDQVVGVASLTGERRVYQPLFHNCEDEKSKAYYNVVQHYYGENHIEHRLSLNSKLSFGEEIISCKLTVSNGLLPYQYLQPGILAQFGDPVPNFIQGTNITAPTKRILPPKKPSYLWNVLTYVTTKLSSLSDVNNLKKLLRLYDWAENDSNKLRINSIKTVDVEYQDKFYHGALRYLVKITITVAEKGFYSHADIFMFGEMLQQFFCGITMINSYLSFCIVCQPSNKELLWQPQIGRSKLI